MRVSFLDRQPLFKSRSGNRSSGGRRSSGLPNNLRIGNRRSPNAHGLRSCRVHHLLRAFSRRKQRLPRRRFRLTLFPRFSRLILLASLFRRSPSRFRKICPPAQSFAFCPGSYFRLSWLSCHFDHAGIFGVNHARGRAF